ncbi:MAG: hypothetical protein JRE10_00830 [Deltaproteobacteria bacterium]|nr:hypothetical protein [Deltaproteobacteria bacterium]
MSDHKRSVQSCPNKKKQELGKLIVCVEDSNGDPANGALVIARKKDTKDKRKKKTEALTRHPKRPVKKGVGELDGVVHFGKDLKPGKYEVYLDGWNPEEKAKTVTVVANEKGRNRRNPHTTLILENKILRMYLDVHRDGQVDDEPADYGDWQWGENGLGAIIMVRTRKNDNIDERIELAFRWDAEKPEERQGWQARLRADEPGRIRVYSGRKKNAQALNNNPLDLTGLEKDADGRISLWIEAADFGADQQEESWRVMLTFTYTTPDKKEVEQRAQLRIAPWIMASDLDPTEKVFAPDGLKETEGINTFTSKAKNVEFIRTKKGKKLFNRDQIKSGFYSAPHYNLVACMTNLEEKHPINLSLPEDVGSIFEYTENEADIGKKSKYKPRESQDNGGNYLVTPPFDGYPFGRIIYGEGDGTKKCTWGNFLKTQLYQKPIVVNSGWLDVGHADEFLSIVPDRKNPNKYKVLIASVRLAFFMLYGAEKIRRENITGDDIYGIVRTAIQLNSSLTGNTEGIDKWKEAAEKNFGRLDASALPKNTYENIDYQANKAPDEAHNGRFEFIYKSNRAPDIKDFFNIPQAPKLSEAPSYCLVRVNTRDIIEKFFLNEPFGKYHYDTQVILDENEKILRRELPVTFEYLPVPLVLNFGAGGAVGVTGDSVNMLVINSPESTHCLIPKPFGPIVDGCYLFQEYIGLELGDMKLIVEFLNDPNFHIEDGEIHCGTNQIPVNDKKKWWEMEAGSKAQPRLVPPPLLSEVLGKAFPGEKPPDVDISVFDI